MQEAWGRKESGLERKVIGVDLKNEVGSITHKDGRVGVGLGLRWGDSPSQSYSHCRGRTKRERGGGRWSNIGQGGWEQTEGGRQGDSRER